MKGSADMLQWLIGSVGVSAVLGVSALLLERVLRPLRLPGA